MRVAGRIRPPGDKSITHRALILSALMHTDARLSGVLTSADAKRTARALRQLGTRVSALRAGREVAVRGARWRRPDGVIDCGNSGTTARLLLGALAGHRFAVRLTGDRSLRRRPMRRVTEPLRAMGAQFEEERGDGLPLVVRGGPLRSVRYASPVASAQVKSAVLLAGVTGGVPVTVTEPVRSRDHTERLLVHLGFEVVVDGTTVRLGEPPDAWPRIDPLTLTIPGDFSSAAFLVAAALLAEAGELVVEGVGLNPTRTGALSVFGRMGARIDVENPRQVAGEPVGDLVVRPAALSAVDVAGEESPSLIDEIPVLAVLASRAEGESRFRSVGELRVKESDRLALLARNLRTVGVEAEVAGDDLVVRGTDRPPTGVVETARDHRLTMAFAVLGRLPRARLCLSERASAGVSYPRFFDVLETVSGG